MDASLYWNAVFTRLNYEKKVSNLLEKKGIRHYCPLNQVPIKNPAQRKFVFAPLFPSVIFVQVPADKSVEDLAQMPHVINPLYRHNKPATFTCADIDTIQNFLEAHETVMVTKTALGMTTAPEPAISQYLPIDRVYTLNLPSLGYALSAKAEPVTNIKLIGKYTGWYRSADSLAFILGLKSNNNKFQ